MGNQTRPRLSSDAQLQFYSTVMHPIHGLTKVYTSKNLPMTFLLKLQRSTVHSRLFHLFQQIQDAQSPHLITLYGFKIERGPACSPCSQSPPPDRTLEYWEYLNYTLGRHVRDRQRRAAPFTQHEVWHVIDAVCGATRLLGDHGLVWEVTPSQLLITPEGRLKCEWSHLQVNNQHLRYYKRLQEGRQQAESGREEGDETEIGWEDFTSPEQQWLVKERQLSSRLNLEKSNSYKFGLLLLYVLTLQPHAVPVKQQLLSLVILQLTGQYPSVMLEVLSGTLNPNPFLRWSLERVREVCSRYFNPEYQLLLSEGRREELQEYNIEAQFRAGSSKHTHRPLQHPSQQLSLLHDSRHPEESLPESRLRVRGSEELRREGGEAGLDRRMLELREYRLRLKDQKN